MYAYMHVCMYMIRDLSRIALNAENRLQLVLVCMYICMYVCIIFFMQFFFRDLSLIALNAENRLQLVFGARGNLVPVNLGAHSHNSVPCTSCYTKPR